MAGSSGAVFVLEFVIKLLLAPSRLRFVRNHWLQLAFLILLALRFFAFLRLLRLGRALPAARVVSSSYRSVGRAKLLLRSRLGYLAALSVVAIVAIAELAYLFERDTQTFGSFADALFWSAAAVIGMQADPVPVTWGARLAMLTAFVCGLVIIASLAGSLGTFLMESRREQADANSPSDSAESQPQPRP